jgi:polar amino acid transport system substrate-binding protein
MKNLFLFLFSFLICFLLQGSTVFALSDKKPTITIAADSWCPINCSRPETKEGVGIDIARAVFEPLGYQVNYVIMPWADALTKVNRGEVTAVVGAGRSDDPKLVFPSSALLAVSDDFYVLRGITWRFQGVETLKRKRLGVIESYGYGSEVKEYIRANMLVRGAVQAQTGANALRDNIKKLQNNEIDVIVESRPVMEYTLASMGLASKIVWAGGVKQDPVYLAFSPALPQSPALAKLYDDGVKRLKASGRLAEFYTAYGLRM